MEQPFVYHKDNIAREGCKIVKRLFIKLKLLKIYYWDLQCAYMCGKCNSYINGKCRQLSFKEYAKDLIKEYALLSHQLR